MDNPNALIAEYFGVLLVVGLVFYAYGAICFMKIAEKTNTPDGWWAWVPIMNVLLMLKIARKPLWWIFLCLIPLVNLIIIILIFVAICEARKKSPALVIGLLLPVVNLVVLGYLAFSD